MDQNDEINPFLTNTVMKYMMSQMTLTELKKMRPVCQFWAEMSVDEISSKKLVQINLTRMKKSEIRKFVNTNCVNWHLYQNFRISSLQRGLLDSVYFFDHFRKITKLHLDIRLGHIKISEEFYVQREIVKILRKVSSNLQNMSLKFQPDDWGIETEWGTYKFEEILTFPKLTKLSLDMYYNPVLDLCTWISESDCPKLSQISITSMPESYSDGKIAKFTKFIQNIQLKNITNLKVKTWLDNSNLEILRKIDDCNFSLMKLRLMIDKFDDFDESTRVLNSFLKVQSSTLIDLNLLIVLIDFANFQDEDEEAFQITNLVKLPRMPNLKNCKISAPGISFAKFDFQHVFPNLVSFEMDDLPGFVDVASCSFPQKKLKSVKLDDRSYPGGVSDFKMDQIWSWWPELLEITLPVHFLRKSMGQEINGVEKLKKIVIHLDPDWDGWFKPELGHLKSLKILEIGSFNCPYNLEIKSEEICEEFYLAFEKTILKLNLTKFVLTKIKVSDLVAEKFRALMMPNGFEYC